jgi:molecular chaperone HscB
MEKDFFELLGLPRKLSIDKVELRKRYILACQTAHPDLHSDGNSIQFEEAEIMTSMLNKAYEVLGDDMKRMSYVLSLHNSLPAEGEAKLPMDFLMEVMDLNEMIEESQSDPDENTQKTLLDQLNSFSEEINLEGKKLIEAYDLGHFDEDGLKDYYLKLKYILRMKENILKFALH